MTRVWLAMTGVVFIVVPHALQLFKMKEIIDLTMPGNEHAISAALECWYSREGLIVLPLSVLGLGIVLVAILGGRTRTRG